ncbi:SGNH/GDSL hydrolase family protein [Maioricimonas rarisocia]|nr:SGNH/GDSL hydrolase family protein [Maioricimonas rarisocia]
MVADSSSDTPATDTAPAASPASQQSASRRRLALRRRLLFAAVAFLLALLLAEGILRVYVALRGWTPNVYAAQLHLFRPHPENGYDLSPNFELRSGTFHISTNSFGLRGPEITARKPQGTSRIVLIGGSAAFGYLVSDGNEAARLVERQLNESGSGPVEVLNAAVPGYNLFQSIVRFREVIAPLEPDYVVLYVGCNDVRYLVSDNPLATEQSRTFSVPAWERILGHSVLYGLVAYRLLGRRPDFGVGRRVQGEPTEEGVAAFRTNLEEIRQEARAAGASLVVCSQATASQMDVAEDLKIAVGDNEKDIARAALIFDTLKATLKEFANQHGILFVDVEAVVPPTTEYLGDGIHLTEEGEQLFADELAGALRQQLQSRPSEE